MAEPELFSAPSDLTLLSDAEVQELETKGVAEFTRVDGLDDVTPELLQYALKLEEDLNRVRAELTGREARTQRLAEQTKAKTEHQMAELRTRVQGESATAQAAAAQASAPVDAEAIAKATAQGVTAAMVSLMGERRGGIDMEAVTRRATASLGETARVAPAANVPEQRLSVTASVDIPGIAHGNSITTLDSLGAAFSKKAKSLPVSRTGSTEGHVVATVNNSFDHTLDDRTSPAQVEDLINHLTRSDIKDSLVAGGGWCAPSEIRYNFFNIACESGMIDLPTFGVTRGGIQFPVSPSLADAVGTNAFGGFAVEFSNASVPFLWTEADDIATVTGSPNKPCVRVPCPSFSEERLECYGLCLTAGNLTDDAYPEATQNMIRLLMSAHAHAMNARLIALMVANSSAATTISGGAATDAATPRLYNSVALAAVDYRERYGMCIDDVLEVVFPSWVREVIRADLAWKAGVEMQAVSDAEIVSFFTVRNIRVQWVDDWQVRGASQFGNETVMTAWPTTVDFLIYAAGTFLHGNGMSLDLGVIRDSVLNAENDFTAAWSEECHLIARVGHESRRYTVGFNVNGSTSALLTGTVRV
jgi:hypothetical protein